MKYKNNRIIVLIVLFLILGILGVSYAFFNYFRVSEEKSQLVAGDVYMHFKETGNEILLTNAFPETQEEARKREDNFIVFTISGKNTTKNKDIYYELKLNEGDDIEGKNRLNPSDLRFELIETINGVSTKVIDGGSYSDFADRRIYVNTIPKVTNSEIEITYQLRMWISENVIISDTEEDANYKTSEYSNSYANIKINVYGDFVEKKVQSPSLTTVEKLNLEIDTIGCPKSGQFFNKAGSDIDLVCEYEDDDGTSYYFRGASTHNYVKWAGYYWRIVRVNGDGNIRMIYAGNANTIDSLENKQEVLANGYNDSTTKYMSIGTSQFNEKEKHTGYEGFMYGDFPNVYSTELKFLEETITTTEALSTTSSYYYASEYTVNEVSGLISLVSPTKITITQDNISELIGKYIFLYTNTTTSVFSYPLMYVESVDNVNLLLTGKKVDRQLLEGLDVKNAYNLTHENKNTSTVLGKFDSSSSNSLNGWYNNNIKGTIYEDEVADSGFWNDRSLYKEEYGTKNNTEAAKYLGIPGRDKSDTVLGIGTEVTYFGAYYRLSILYAPRLKIEQQNDYFTVKKSNGNKTLVNSIGLLTADEAVLAGGLPWSNNSEYYLYTGHYYWTLTPSYHQYLGASVLFCVSANGAVSNGYNANVVGAIRPVISINPNKVKIKGIGTWDNPFIFE